MIRINNQLNAISIGNFKAVILAFSAALTSILLLHLSWYLVLLPVFIIPVIIYGERVFIFYAIISFLTLTSTISVELRTIVQVFFILILFYLFIKEYGLNFSAFPKVPKQVSVLILLLYLAMIISTIFSNYVLLGIKEIFRLTVFLIIVYMFYGFLSKSKNIKLFLWALFFTGLIYYASVFYKFAQNDFSLIELNISELLKVKDSYINVNGIGAFFIIITSILLGYFFIYKGDKKRKYFAFFILIYLTGLVIANSRAAILSTIISSLIMLYFYNRKILYILIAAALILVPFLFIQPFSNYIDIYFRVERLTSGRNWIWEIVLNIVKNNPILGAGPAATKFEFYKYLPFMLGSPAEKYIALHIDQIEFGQAHSFYLFFLTDLGILGFFTSLFLPYVFINTGVKTIKKFKSSNTEFYWLSIAITAAGIGLFVRGIFEWGNLISYGTLEADLPFWLIFIILIYMYKIPNPDKKFAEFVRK